MTCACISLSNTWHAPTCKLQWPNKRHVHHQSPKRMSPIIAASEYVHIWLYTHITYMGTMPWMCKPTMSYLFLSLSFSLSLSLSIYTHIYKCICTYIRRPLPERERVSLHCHLPIPSNPADSKQPLVQYLAMSHPADCHPPILQSAACWIASF